MMLLMALLSPIDRCIYPAIYSTGKKFLLELVRTDLALEMADYAFKWYISLTTSSLFWSFALIFVVVVVVVVVLL